VGNAVKFTSEGHVLIRVVGFEAEDDGDDRPPVWRLHVTVEDTGIGIPEDMREHIFGSFAQVESATNRSFEGTGLGLAITRQLVALMGGEIWVESEERRGSCFGFTLSLPAAEPLRRALPRVEPHLGTVLVVAPPSLDADIMGRQFAQLGLDVVRAVTGSEALAMAGAERRPQLVAIDDGLPDTDGRALAVALEDAGLTCPRLLLCASPHDAQRAEADLAGASGTSPVIHGVLTRPVLRAQLFAALANLPRSGHAEPSGAQHAAPHAGAVGDGRNPGAGDGPALHAADITAQAAAAPDGAGPPIPFPAATSAMRPMRVLAAEDNRTNRFVFSKMLRQLEIEIAFAEDGREAVAQAESFAPDLVFMDISMPRMDGKEAARAIRAAEAAAGHGRRVPIVAMTAHALAGDREEILAAGIDDYLTKPLKRAQLVAAVLDHCPQECLAPRGDARAAAS
jgi:hypothetical protein